MRQRVKNAWTSISAILCLNITNACYAICSNKNNSSDFCQPQITYLELYVYGKISVEE